MKLVAVLLISMAIMLAVAFLNTRRRGTGTHRVPDDRDRPMTQWAEEREVGPPQSDSSEVAASESVPNEPLFPAISITSFGVQPSSADGSVYEVQPFADRHPHVDWATAFHLATEADDEIEWSRNGSAHCRSDDIERVKSRLNEIAEATNQLMDENFARAMEIPGRRADVERLLALEAQAASVAPDRAYPIEAPEATT